MIRKQFLFSIALMSTIFVQPLCAMLTPFTQKAIRTIRASQPRTCTTQSTKIILTKNRINDLLIGNGLRPFAEKSRIAERLNGKENDPNDIAMSVFLHTYTYYSDLADELQNPAIKEISSKKYFPLILKTILTDHPKTFKYIKTDSFYIRGEALQWEKPYGNFGFDANNYAKE